MEAILCDYAVTGVALVEIDGKEASVVSLAFPKENPPYPDEQENMENFDEVLLTVAAAKALIVDVRDALDSILNGTDFS